MVALTLTVLGGAVPASPGVEAASTEPYRVETESLVLVWTETPDSAEVAAITTAATDFHARVAETLGHQPDRPISIVLGGPAERPGGDWEYPRVDWMGRILLFRFTPGFESYLTPLAHEMVHAFRFQRRQTANWFFEEGFAEFVALRVDSSLAGFPWFDFPVPVVAGQWLARGEGIPLSTLHDRHEEVSLPCAAQSYALRSAFFTWLGDTFGDEAVYRAAKDLPAGGAGSYEAHFGQPLAELEAAWRSALLAEYHALPEVETLAERYRRETPIRYQRVCSEGEDF